MKLTEREAIRYAVDGPNGPRGPQSRAEIEAEQLAADLAEAKRHADLQSLATAAPADAARKLKAEAQAAEQRKAMGIPDPKGGWSDAAFEKPPNPARLKHHVKWHPPATEIKDSGGGRGNANAVADSGAMAAGIGRGTVKPMGVEVKWSKPWQVAQSSQGHLWVCCEDPTDLEVHAAELQTLAGMVKDGSIKLGAQPPLPRRLDKHGMLHAITALTERAIAAGASARDVRLAVYAAMGLDPED